jgi:hypothetical protein
MTKSSAIVNDKKHNARANSVLLVKKLLSLLRIPVLLGLLIVFPIEDGLAFSFFSAGKKENPSRLFSFSLPRMALPSAPGQKTGQKSHANTFELQVVYGLSYSVSPDINGYLRSLNKLMSKETYFYTQVNGAYKVLDFGHNYEVELYIKLRPMLGLTVGAGRFGVSAGSRVDGTILDTISFNDDLSLSFDLNYIEFGFKTEFTGYSAIEKTFEELPRALPPWLRGFFKAFLGYYSGQFQIDEDSQNDLESTHLTFDAPYRTFGGGAGGDVIVSLSKNIGFVFKIMARFFLPSNLIGDYRLTGTSIYGPFEDSGKATAWSYTDYGYNWLSISPVEPSLEEGASAARKASLLFFSIHASLGLAFRF